MAKRPAKPAQTATLDLALRLQAALDGDPGYVADMPTTRTGGIIEDTAAFEVRGVGGTVFKVIVSRQH